MIKWRLLNKPSNEELTFTIGKDNKPVMEVTCKHSDGSVHFTEQTFCKNQIQHMINRLEVILLEMEDE